MKPLGAADPSAVASYRLIGVLGGGGMGRVYLGESRTGRRVAIKVIRDELAEDPVFRRRFAREVAAAKVVSPLYTAAVVDADPDADSPWLATTYIDGPNLTELVLNEGPLSPRAVLTLAAGLSEALASIHRVGLVHRDLKPSNVIINSAGPHIIDFGIALTAETTGRLTTSKVVGTPSYIAPEIIQGADPTPAGDMFSLGATLVFAASGKHLVGEGTVYSQILQITSGRFDLEAVPKELRPLIVRCISPEPKDRPTADELAHILVASGVSSPAPGWYSTQEPAPVVLAGPVPTTLVPVPRRRLLLIGGLLGAAAVGSAVGVATGLFGRPGTEAKALWQAVPTTAPATGPPTPPNRTGPGSVIWDGRSGARSSGASSGTQQPGLRVVVDVRRQHLIASNGPQVFAVGRDGTQIWTTPQLPTSAVNLRPWGDAVLATDAKMAWLINNENGVVLFTQDLVETERAASAANGDNPDNLAIEIGGIAVAGERAFIGLGTAVIAINRAGIHQWRVPRAWRSGGRGPVGVPRAASDRWLAVHTTTDSVVQLNLINVYNGVQEWTISYNPGPQNNDQGKPPGPPPGQDLGTGAPPVAGPRGGPGDDDAWSAMEARFSTDHLAVRDSRAIRVLRLGNGDTAWQRVFERPVDGMEVVADLLVVAADQMTAFAINSDVARWPLDLRGARMAPTPDGKRIIIAAETDILAVDLNGKVLWRNRLPANVSGMRAERVTTDDHTAFLTFRPPPERSTDVDAVAFTLDG